MPIMTQAEKDSYNAIADDVDGGWDDNTSAFVPSAVHPSTTPTYEDMGNGMYALLFRVGAIAFISFHIKHDILIGSKVYPHIHFSCTPALVVGETIEWEISGVKAIRHNDIQAPQSLSAPLTTIQLTYTADGTEIAGDHLVVEVGDAQAQLGMEQDTLALMRVTRVGGTFTGNVFGHTADLHYQVGRVATPNKAYPFT